MFVSSTALTDEASSNYVADSNRSLYDSIAHSFHYPTDLDDFVARTTAAYCWNDNRLYSGFSLDDVHRRYKRQLQLQRNTMQCQLDELKKENMNLECQVEALRKWGQEQAVAAAAYAVPNAVRKEETAILNKQIVTLEDSLRVSEDERGKYMKLAIEARSEAEVLTTRASEQLTEIMQERDSLRHELAAVKERLTITEAEAAQSRSTSNFELNELQEALGAIRAECNDLKKQSLKRDIEVCAQTTNALLQSNKTIDKLNTEVVRLTERLKQTRQFDEAAFEQLNKHKAAEEELMTKINQLTEQNANLRAKVEAGAEEMRMQHAQVAIQGAEITRLTQQLPTLKTQGDQSPSKLTIRNIASIAYASPVMLKMMATESSVNSRQEEIERHPSPCLPSQLPTEPCGVALDSLQEVHMVAVDARSGRVENQSREEETGDGKQVEREISSVDEGDNVCTNRASLHLRMADVENRRRRRNRSESPPKSDEMPN